MITKAYRTFYGLSTDIKPTAEVSVGHRFVEVDTSKLFIFDENINPATNNGWWESSLAGGVVGGIIDGGVF